MPDNFFFGGGSAETQMHPLVAVWLLIAIVLIQTLPRHKVIVPYLLAAFTIPFGQVVVLGGLHFTQMRVLVLAGLVRWLTTAVLSRKHRLAGGFNALDRALVFWTVSTLVIVSLRWMESQALIKSLGDFLDALGGYLVARFLIPDRAAIIRTVKLLAVVAAIHGVVMIGEQMIHVNVFGLLGGVEAGIAPIERGGGYRSGAQLGPIVSGFFGAALTPMFLWLWTGGKSRIAALMGIAGAAIMVITSHSSTGLMAYGAALFALAFWPLRKRMRLVRWGTVGMLLGLQLFMQSPVWWLIKRADLTGSSASYHRAMLVDNCIRHFGDWWLMGTTDYINWGFLAFDQCNQFVEVAQKGGLITLILFIAVYARSFAAIGKGRKQVSGNRKQEWFFWCLGVSLFVHVVSAFGMSLPPQVQAFWFPTLAFISVAAYEARQAAPGTVVAPQQEQSAPDLAAAGT